MKAATLLPCSSSVAPSKRSVRPRRVTIAKPLFPGYLFVLIEQRWRVLLSTYGLRGIVMRGDSSLGIVPRTVIEELRKRQDRDGFINLPKRQRGDRVRITRGMFRDHVGIVQNMTPSERIGVLLDVLGGKTTVLVAGEDVVDVQPRTVTRALI